MVLKTVVNIKALLIVVVVLCKNVDDDFNWFQRKQHFCPVLTKEKNINIQMKWTEMGLPTVLSKQT